MSGEFTWQVPDGAIAEMQAVIAARRGLAPHRPGGACRSETGRIPLHRGAPRPVRYTAVCDDCGFTVGPTTLRAATTALDDHFGRYGSAPAPR